MSSTTGGDVIASKLANALIANVEYSQLVKDVVDALPHARTVQGVLDDFKRRYGDVWVGGRATLTATALVFEPNAVNSALQEGELELTIPVETISAVTLEGGFLSKIIAIATPLATVRLRCFGAGTFARQIRDAAPRAAG